MEWEKDLAQALQLDLSGRKAKNPRYSIRAYARDLKIAPATLSEFLRGCKTWNLTPERGQDIISRMNISSTQKKRLFVRMGLPFDGERQEMSAQNYDLLTDWHFSAIFFAHNLPAPLRTPESLSARFGIDLQKVKDVIQHLKKKNLLSESEDGKTLEATKVNWFAEKAPPVSAVRTHHRNNLELAVRALEEVEPGKRDITTLTFVGSSQKIEEARKEIRQFHERITHLMSSEVTGENDEVMQMCVALYPVQFKEPQT